MTEASENPFDPTSESAYRRWRDAKLRRSATAADNLVIEIADLARPTRAEQTAIIASCRRANLAIYACRSVPQHDALIRGMARFTRCFGLTRTDAHLLGTGGGFTPLEAVDGGRKGGYIPYSDRALSWHTDGYYNTPEAQVRAVYLHYASDAAAGGENALLDHEIAYIRLRDEDPALVAALMHPQAMTIPANREGGVEIRPERTGPVFSVDPSTGTLHMRYTARTRSIVWRDDDATRRAVAFLAALLSSDEPCILRHRFAPGQGLICNNVLHNRAGFRDDAARGHRRLVWRARFLDRIRDTAPVQHPTTDKAHA